MSHVDLEADRPVSAPSGPVTGRLGRFEGLVAIVTGGSRGIGLAIARRLVDEGSRVVITGRDPRALEEAEAQLGAERVLAVGGDAEDPAARAQTVSLALDRFGRIDLLVNNVGAIGPRGPLTEIAEDEFQAIVRTNCLGPLGWIAEVAARAMSGGGAVVNITSGLGRTTSSQRIGAYSATKAMLEHLTRQLAVELAPRIRVNAVAPALVRTQMGSSRFEGRESEIAATYPMGRIGDPRDIAASVVHLLSRDADWVTGQSVAVDGGILLMSDL